MALLKFRLLALLVAVPLTLTACFASATPSTTPPTASPKPSVEAPPSGAGSGVSGLPLCPGQTWPPYGLTTSVPGVSVRVLDMSKFEIVSTATQTYYFDTFVWNEEHLECGQGLTDSHMQGGVLNAGGTAEIHGGSRPAAPVTVAIWAQPCGLGCYRPPDGLIVVPVSSVVPSPLYT